MATPMVFQEQSSWTVLKWQLIIDLKTVLFLANVAKLLTCVTLEYSGWAWTVCCWRYALLPARVVFGCVQGVAACFDEVTPAVAVCEALPSVATLWLAGEASSVPVIDCDLHLPSQTHPTMCKPVGEMGMRRCGALLHRTPPPDEMVTSVHCSPSEPKRPTSSKKKTCWYEYMPNFLSTAMLDDVEAAIFVCATRMLTIGNSPSHRWKTDIVWRHRHISDVHTVNGFNSKERCVQLGFLSTSLCKFEIAGKVI